MNDQVASKPVEERLSLAENIMTLRSRIAGSSENLNLKVLLANRLNAARRVLLGRASGSDVFMNPAAGVEALRKAAEGIEEKSDAERQQIGHYIRGIYASMRALATAEAKHTQSSNMFALPDDLTALVDGAIGRLGEDDKARELADPIVDDCIAGGGFGDDIKGELASAADRAANQADPAITSLQRMLADQFASVLAEQKTRYAAVRELQSRYAEIGQAEYERHSKEYNDWLYEVYKPVEAANRAKIAAQKASASAIYAEVGKKMVDQVMSKSQIGEDEAAEWAKAQTITKAAVGRLKKLDYPVDQVRKDMADFYRITQGRVATVKIDSSGDRRANATDIEAHGKVGTINLGSGFDKRVLWHELAHHIEADPVAKIAAGRFIRRRSEDGKVYSLRSLTGNKGYARTEGAFKGGFFNPYVGKRYADGITEVFAMGVESFSNPETLARRAAEDPQTLEFVGGFISRPMGPLAKAHQGLREMLQEMQQEATAVTGDWVENRIKDLAAGVTIEPDTDTSWLGRLDWMVSKYQQVGRFKDSPFYVFKGKVRNPSTWRKVNGLLIIQATEGGLGVRHYEYASTDLATAKAAYAYYERQGVFPSYDILSDESKLRKAMP